MWLGLAQRGQAGDKRRRECPLTRSRRRKEKSVDKMEFVLWVEALCSGVRGYVGVAASRFASNHQIAYFSQQCNSHSFVALG